MKVLTTTFVLMIWAFTLLGQNVKTIKIGDIQKMMTSQSDKILILNFWATWCAPCIKELPLFELLNESRNDVEISLVSIDLDLDPNPEKIHRFVARKKLNSRILILDETDPNSWIDKIDKGWTGAIPATLVVNLATGMRRFVEKELKEGELEQLIDSVKK